MLAKSLILNYIKFVNTVLSLPTLGICKRGNRNYIAEIQIEKNKQMTAKKLSQMASLLKFSLPRRKKESISHKVLTEKQ